MMVARDLDMDAGRVSEQLSWPEAEIEAAFRYARDYPEDVRGEVEANDSVTRRGADTSRAGWVFDEIERRELA
jgi:hypothetical protein